MKKLSFIFLLLYWYHIFFIPQASGQEIIAEAVVDSTTLLIGDQRKLKLSIQSQKKLTVHLPLLNDSIGKIEIVKKGKIDTILSENRQTIAQTLVITCFDTGTFTIPPLRFSYKKDNDTTSYYKTTEGILLRVNGIVVDTTKEIKDIKPPLQVPYSFLDFLKENATYIIAGILIIILAIAIFYWRNKRRKMDGPEKTIPLRPPYEIALEELQTLEKEKLWQKGAYKEYHSKLSDIIRVYIEERFNVMALELTSEQTITTLRSLTGEQRLQLKQLLEMADLVKFAKAVPVSHENELSLQNAYSFINNTKAEVISERKESPVL